MNDSLPLSNTHIMAALFFKDWRFFRVPMIALGVLSIGCYLIAFVAVFTAQSARQVSFVPSVLNIVYGSCLCAINLTALLASAFGGISIAGEREDRTADFLAMLPITRHQIVASKWLVSFFILGFWAGLHALIALTLFPHLSNSGVEIIQSAAVWTGFLFCLFGVAWLFSTLIKSGPISACASIALTLSFASVAAICMQRPGRNDSVPSVVAAVTFSTGLVSLISGTICYSKRVAP